MKPGRFAGEHRRHWALARLRKAIKNQARDLATEIFYCSSCGAPVVASQLGRQAHAERRPQCASAMDTEKPAE